MAAFRCIIYFSGPQFSRWTENYFWLGNSITAAMDALHLLALVRLPLLGDLISIDQLRVNDDNLERYTLPAGVGQTQRASGSTLSSNTTVLVHLQSSDGGVFSRSAYLRGFSREVCRLDPLGKGLLQGWIANLASLGFRLKCQRRLKRWRLVSATGYADQNSNAGNIPLPNFPPDSYQAKIALLTLEDTGIPLYDPDTGYANHVNIRGIRVNDGVEGENLEVNGNHTVVGSQGNLLVINGEAPSAGIIAGTGTVAQLGWVYPKITAGIIRGIRQRNTGNRTNYHSVITTPWQNIIPAQPPPVLAPLPPPTFPPGPSTILPPMPPTATLRTAFDTVQFLDHSYLPHPDGMFYPITIARVVSLPYHWMVFCTGTSLKVDQSTGLMADVAASLGPVPDTYTTDIVKAVYSLVPSDANVLMAGDSLGGMECQNTQLVLTSAGYNVLVIVTFNSPMTTFPRGRVIVNRLAEQGDYVINSTPMGFLLSISGNPEQHFMRTKQYIGHPIDAHLAIYNEPQLLEIGPLGAGGPAGQDDEIVLGEQHYFQTKFLQ